MIVFKLLTETEAAALATDGRFAGSPDDAADGFVHLSTAEQVPGTAAKHFAGRGPLVLVALDADRLGEALKWEPSRGGALFPHLYRGIEASDVLWQVAYGPDASGTWPVPGAVAPAADGGAA
ncbi:MAG: DUF952 domain-containing protein [Pseudomonadota bacterium]